MVARKPRNIHLGGASQTQVGGTVRGALVTGARFSVHETILTHGGTGPGSEVSLADAPRAPPAVTPSASGAWRPGAAAAATSGGT